MSKNTQEWLLTVCFLLVLAAAFMVANQRDSIKQDSRGATAEKELAHWRGIPVYFWPRVFARKFVLHQSDVTPSKTA